MSSLLAIALIFIVSALPQTAKAHLELYHNVEINLTETEETGIVRFFFTIHAPELLVGYENAGSEIFDAEWLRTRSDDEFNSLFDRGRIFVKEKFGFHIDTEQELDISKHLRFENPATIRDEKYQSGVPVGCILVSADLQLKLGAQKLGVTLKKDAGKRLLLVCTRKGAFPETNDMDTGDSTTLLLPTVKDTQPASPNEKKKTELILPGITNLELISLIALSSLGIVFLLCRMKIIS